MPAGVLRMLAGRKPSAGAFDPETDITWHSLFWAEGTDFAAQGYTDTDTVTTWPNEGSDKDVTGGNTATTFDESVTALNNQAAVAFSGSNHGFTTGTFTSALTYSISIVAVCTYTGDFDTDHLCDGLTVSSSARNTVKNRSGGSTMQIYAGTSRYASGSYPSGGLGIIATFDGSTGNDTLTVNGTLEINASAGSATVAGLRLGAGFNGTASWQGAIALFGVYEGDITADGSWSDMQTWADDHYGVTL